MSLIPLVALIATAAVHVVPASVLFRGQGASQLYGSMPMSPEVVLLLRHRAAGFATLAGMATAALWLESWRVPVLVAALASVATFLILWWRSDVRTAALRRVAVTDLALMPLLLAGLALA